MGSTVQMLLWTWIVLDSGAAAISMPDISDGMFIEECVREHNRARSSVSPPASNMLYMTWDEGLARTARAWASHCMMKHNPDLDDARRMHPTHPSVGENIWAGYPPSSFSVSRAMKRWMDEKFDYSYKWNNCTAICGHYTQVVWASSYKVGCAAHLCPKGVANFDTRAGAVYVCNYATAGNLNAQQPYQSLGAACSGCKGSCVDNLCRDQERDSQKSYNWTPDGDPNLAAADSQYVYILVARPIALIFTFITAYAVHHLYPNVFCYE